MDEYLITAAARRLANAEVDPAKLARLTSVPPCVYKPGDVLGVAYDDPLAGADKKYALIPIANTDYVLFLWSNNASKLCGDTWMFHIGHTKNPKKPLDLYDLKQKAVLLAFLDQESEEKWVLEDVDYPGCTTRLGGYQDCFGLQVAGVLHVASAAFPIAPAYADGGYSNIIWSEAD
ncbi:hypothetical protein MKEN_00649900 [Mycena kentingensis (nom. inval.)]|nr:hypothetical protein MKEN_00649900 [Mycena kentingensis (nom. inval.)]